MKRSDVIREYMEVYAQSDRLRDKVADATAVGQDATDGRLEMIRKVEEVRRWAQNKIIMLKEQIDG